MKTFLAIFTGNPAAMQAWQSLPPAELEQRKTRGIAAWHDWAARRKASIVETGGPLGRTKRITQQGIADIRNAMGAYVVVRAETHEEAAKLFVDHPHFTIFPGDGVEVMECLPIPSA